MSLVPAMAITRSKPFFNMDLSPGNLLPVKSLVTSFSALSSSWDVVQPDKPIHSTCGTIWTGNKR